MEKRTGPFNNPFKALEQTVPDNDLGKLHLRFQPRLETAFHGVSPFPAVDKDGDTM